MSIPASPVVSPIPRQLAGLVREDDREVGRHVGENPSRSVPSNRWPTPSPPRRAPTFLQHKDNPVDWHPWGAEARRLARETDRPILVSIGYSSCHWCHVMERESFEDDETAGYMNERFVA